MYIRNMNTQYDTILICNLDEFINEAMGDPRSQGHGLPSNDKPVKVHYWYDDPKLYAANAFGRMMASELNSWRSGYSAKVSDFGKWVVVEVTHHDHISGRSASKTFLVVFDGGPKGTDKGGGMVLTTANKYRTISGYSQAVSYIKSVAGALESATSQKL